MGIGVLYKNTSSHCCSSPSPSSYWVLSLARDKPYFSLFSQHPWEVEC